jgi:rod shape determining protein RodA
MAREEEGYIFTLQKQASEYFDWSTFMITIMLVVMGLISIYSATYESGTSVYFYKQLVYGFMGLVSMLVVAYLPEKWIRNFAVSGFIFALLLLIAVLLFGKTVSGTKGWFQFGGASFQPAEFAKLATLVFLAFYLSNKGIDVQNLRDTLISGAIILLPIALIIIQPDVGSASVLVAMLMGILLWSGYDLYILYIICCVPVIIIVSLMGTSFFVTIVSITSIISAIFKKKIWIMLIGIMIMISAGYLAQDIFKFFPSNTRDRIQTFLYPKKDPLKKGYNVMQSVLAVGSGGITGKGYLKGSQTQLRYIPEQRTDFIFCVPAEEFGFLGGGFVIVLMGLLILRAIRIAYESDSKFYSIICFGIASMFFYHALINLGMVIRLVPVMGIPLPLMSYGGTALIINMTLIGLLLNAYRAHRKKER